MKCYWCKDQELTWQNDYDVSHEEEEYEINTTLECPKCGSFFDCWHPKQNTDLAESRIKDSEEK